MSRVPATTRFALSPKRPRIARWLDGPDLRWGRRIVVTFTAFALLAVACSDGGVGPGPRPPPRSRRPAPRHNRRPTPSTKKIDTIPGMPPVVDPSNLYSETATGKMSDAVKGALTRVYVPNRRVEHGVGDRPVDDAGRRHVRRRAQPAARRAVVGPQDAVGHEQRARARTDGTLTPIDPNTGKPGQSVVVDDPYNMYFTPDGKYGHHRGRGAEAARLPRPAHDEGGELARRAGVLGRQPRRLPDRRPVRDLHV